MNNHDSTETSLSGVFIGIAGLIGAGKTTLATALAKELNLPVFYEPVTENTYLEDFYTDMKSYSFPMQIFLLNKRFKQQQQIVWSGTGGVQDRTIYEHSVFAKMLCDGGFIDTRDYKTYVELFQSMSNFIKRPDVIVHLDLSPGEAYKRIQMRNRECESGITLEYLEDLYSAYNDFINDISRIIPVIKVDYREFRTAEEMASVIKTEYKKIANIRSVAFDNVSGPCR